MLRCFLRLAFAVVPGSGPAVDAASQPGDAGECPAADAEGLRGQPPLGVRVSNETSQTLVIGDQTQGAGIRYFEVEGVANTLVFDAG